MSFIGTVIILLGLYLLDSVVKNRAPIGTLKGILQNPKAVKDTITSAPQAWQPTPQVERGGSGAGGNSSNIPNAPPVGPLKGMSDSSSSAVATVLAFERAQIGKPYVWGAEGPNSYDCSGLVQTAFKQVGIMLPRLTYGQAVMGKGVSKSELQPGDLIFPEPGHVQTYSGNGMIIEAANPRDGIREVKEWGPELVCRRIIGYVKPSVST